MITLVREKLPNYVHADLFEVQVMTPMRKGVLGSIRLNSILQEFLNPPSAEKAEKEYGETTFRVGDKVMQIKNNYQIEWTSYNRSGIPVDKGAGVFNGDLGRIREINTFAELVTVDVLSTASSSWRSWNWHMRSRSTSRREASIRRS